LSHTLPETKADFKKRLERLKLWHECCNYREELKRKQIQAKEYWVMMMEKYSPGKCREMLESRHGPGPASGIGDPGAAFGVPAAAVVKAPDKGKKNGAVVGVDILPNGMPLVSANTWEGRAYITFEDAVLWADSMRAISGTKPEDCPSAVAYEKLWGAQNSMEGSKYLDSLVAKIASKRKNKDEDGADIGAYTDQLLKMLEDSKGGSE